MEELLKKDLDAVENELLCVRTQLDDLLQKQEELQSKKTVLQFQLESLVQSREQAHREELQSVDWESGQFEWSSEVQSLLKSIFKLSSLRFLQSSTINATLSGHDVILVMPTGGGKSLCYQLPSLLRPGVTLVISPLVSLMEDQLLSAKRFGIGAALLNASSSREEVNQVHADMTDKKKSSLLKLLYVTPEKLSKSKRFMSKLEKMYEIGRLSRIVIDEVHCVSQWGHDFRPDYKILGILKQQFPNAPILGLTATATTKVLADCQALLSLGSCLTFKASYNRKNLFYEVRPKPISQKSQIEEIATLIKVQFSEMSGIVYCLSRINAEDICAGLCEAGISAGCYHTDRLPQDKTKTHKQWLNGSIQVIVATIAFGMGIDKPDVRFVIHHSLSKSMENYYQESGRAGRDGNIAHCILLYRAADIFRLSAMVFTERTGLVNLSAMMKYCINETNCRRAIIAECFNDTWSPHDCTGRCDVCAKLSGADGGDCILNEGSEKYKVDNLDVSSHIKDLVLIVQHNQEKEQRLTAAKLVEIWRSKCRGGNRPLQVSPAYDMSIELCERILVTALLEGTLKKEFHYTPYSTICYMGLGKKAELVKRGLLQIHLPLLKEKLHHELSFPEDSSKSNKKAKRQSVSHDDEPCSSTFIRRKGHGACLLSAVCDKGTSEPLPQPVCDETSKEELTSCGLTSYGGESIRKGKKRRHWESTNLLWSSKQSSTSDVVVISDVDSD